MPGLEPPFCQNPWFHRGLLSCARQALEIFLRQRCQTQLLELSRLFLRFAAEGGEFGFESVAREKFQRVIRRHY